MKAEHSTVKTRFAPSPTGFMHFGNVRTALFNYLFAKRSHGQFLIRIEDTDLARSEGQFRDSIFTDLTWLGLHWDDEPVYQSARQELYDQYYETLEKQGLVYPCFCTEPELVIQRKVQLASGQPPRYPGTCLHLTEEQIAIKKAQGIPWTLRFRIPKGEKIEFVDLIKGLQKFETDHIGDFIVRRHDGTPPFMYCNAIDDSLMGITHTLRGDDHLTNTPRQMLILKALALPMPQYGHFPTILGSDSRPLSKRTGSRSIQDLRAEGYLKEALNNYMARLGHHDPSQNLLSLSELAEHFDLQHISKSPAHYDEHQLHFWQKEAMHHAPWNEVWALFSERLDEELKQKIVDRNEIKEFVETIKSNIVLPQEAEFWAKKFFMPLKEHILQFGDQFYEEKALNILKSSNNTFFKTAIEEFKNFEATKDWKGFLKVLQEKTNTKGKNLYMPIRAALTGVLHGPELIHIFNLLGKEEVLHRFTAAEKHTGNS